MNKKLQHSKNLKKPLVFQCFCDVGNINKQAKEERKKRKTLQKTRSKRCKNLKKTSPKESKKTSRKGELTRYPKIEKNQSI